jgi:hypothetical protein
MRHEYEPPTGEETMSHKEKKIYVEKYPSGRKPKQEVVTAFKERAPGEDLPCAAAFALAHGLKVPAEEIGFTADSLEVRIVKCQLGLFGYRPEKRIVKPAATVSSALKQAIREALIKDRLPCKAAWEIAERLSLSKMEVSAACETMKVKISPCQLGTF